MLRCLMLVLVLVAAAAAAQADEIDFAHDVVPVLKKHCAECHTGEKSEGGFSFNTQRQLLESGYAETGKPDESRITELIRSRDAEEQMPPKDRKRLSANEINTLRQWIAAGAKHETHWSFVPPVRPKPHTVANDEWSRSDIDRFVLENLYKKQLTPSPQADPYTLIRRVYLDLTGLPPTPEAADRFALSSSAEAFESIVDELLRSPKFGEHWATMWLDLARYADTKGYEKDQPRNIWRYRDWVIEAFNNDMPYDQFTAEQIAGDLFESPTTEQVLATAFHRNTMTNDEGGTDNEEFRIAAVKDRVDTTIQVWMGLTMGCAKCHSHKYDPISQHEYYRFMA
ncbi:MAG: DUF1549 domain-containing protein, partial [Fuerstiella sp.]